MVLAPEVKRAVFLDRDGVLIEDRGYVHRVEDVALFPGAGLALKRLCEAGFLLFVVTNQSGIGRGFYSAADLERVNAHLMANLAQDGVRLTKVYYAPEAPDQPSRGRKPSPQFLFDARDEFGVDLARSYLVGDKLADLQCGWNAGVRKSLLVRTGHGAQTEQNHQPELAKAVVVDNLPQAVDWILCQ
jgi:D-glycero-D-manno-heptose 1,7-bisphosphate phosphatase